jgi:phosphoglycolate phosphatase-like HAD superfamily hydrolase
MSKVILCDVDGTLANTDHREHFLTVRPKKWKEYKKQAHLDKPYEDIVWLMKLLKKAGNTILIVTARSEDERKQTKEWLDKTAGLKGVYDRIYMRGTDDYRDHTIVKKELLNDIRLDGYDPYMVFDDHNGVVEMWRNSGLRCLQVQYGDF